MATTAPARPRRRLVDRLPVVHQLRQSVGLQRGMLVAGLVITGAFLLVALFAPLLAPYGYSQLRSDDGAFGAQQPPSAEHLLGTTVGGYDVLSRVLWGAQTAFLVIVVAVVLSIFAGVFLGLVSGYLGGWLDRVLVVICDAIYAFPTLLLAIVMSIVISGGQSNLWAGIFAAAISITVVYIPQYFRVIRAETVRIKGDAFVESAKVIGASTPRIMFRHVLRNATRTLPLIFTSTRPRRSSPWRAWASSASASSRRRRPSGATTSTRRCPTSRAGSGGPRCSPASRSSSSWSASPSSARA